MTDFCTESLRAFSAGLNILYSIQLTTTMADTNTKISDFQQVTLHGRIAHMEPVEYQGDTFLSVVLAHTISEQCDVRIRFTNSNEEKQDPCRSRCRNQRDSSSL